MRQLETFSAEAEARAVADAMYVDGIETTVSSSREGGYVVWVHDDARVEEARELLTFFRAHPKDPKFTEGVKSARERRRDAERKHLETERRVEAARRDLERRSGMGTATLFFVLASVGVYVMENSIDAAHLMGAIAFADLTDTSAFASIARGEVWRLITPAFISRSLFNLFFSSILLLALGNAFEQRHRSRYLVLLALAAAAAGNAFVAYMMSPFEAVSMRGVIAALFAYLYVRHRLEPRDWEVPPYQTTFWVPLWFIISLAIVQMRPLAYMDGAGFLVGGLAAFFAAKR